MKNRKFKLESTTGQILNGIIWTPKVKAKGIVQIVHGMAEHINRYDKFAQSLCEVGYIVVGHDQLGHGRTAKIKGYFASTQGWDALVKDIHKLKINTSEKYGDLPYFLLGHSMGSFLVRTYIKKYNENLDGIILSGTGKPLRIQVFLGKSLAKLMSILNFSKKPASILDKMAFSRNNNQFKPAKTSFDWLSSDEEAVNKYINDPLCGFIFTARGYYDLFSGLKFISKKNNLLRMDKNLPMYLFSGGRDPVGDNGEGVKNLVSIFQKIGVKNITLKIYPEGRHEMLNETNKAEVIKDLIKWLDINNKLPI